MIEIEAVPAFQDNYIWLIKHPPSGGIAIVDPGDATPVLEKINQDGLVPRAILATHHHPDHVGGIPNLLQHYDIPVYGPAHENIPAISHKLDEGDTVDLEDFSISFRILYVPGHTSGAIAYHGNGMVFTGDTLFMSGCGRLFEGTPAQMHQSLDKLASLPDATMVYCAHEYTLANLDFAQAVEPANADIRNRISQCKSLREQGLPTVPAPLALEKLTNPFLRAHVAEVVQSASNHAGRALEPGTDVFTEVRSWKDNF